MPLRGRADRLLGGVGRDRDRFPEQRKVQARDG